MVVTPAIVPSFSRETVDGKTVLVVDVYPGRNTPYHIKAEGIDGVYLRVGATTRKAELDQIEDLILRGGNKTYDSVIRETETATETAMKNLCRRIGAAHRENTGERIKVTPLMLEGWGVVRKVRDHWCPSVAFQWLAANTDHFARVQCALFADEERTEFLDRQEYSGSVVDQVEESMKFVLRSIRRGAKIEGLYRKDFYELPPEALREAIVNAVAHRDYRQHAYIQVSVSPGKVEIVSPGSLFDGLTKDEMLSGKSKLRNPVLADIFHKMGMIEKWGTGLPRIFARCAKAGVPAPMITVGGSTVAVSFKRLGESVTHEGATFVGNVGNPVGNVGNPVGNAITGDSNLEKVVMDCLRGDAKMSAARIAKIANVTMRTIERALTRLKASGRIRRVGGTRGSWEVLK